MNSTLIKSIPRGSAMKKRFAMLAGMAMLASSSVQAQVQHLGFDRDRFTPTNALAAQGTFLSQLSSWGTETYASAVYGTNQAMTYGSFGTGTMADPTFFPFFNTISNQVGLLGMNGRVTAGGGLTAAPISFTFSPGSVNGFGMFLSGMNDIGAPQPTVLLHFLLGGNAVHILSVDNPHANGDNTMFVGLTGVAFDQVDMWAQDGDGIWINDVTIGGQVSTVPEPSSFALIGAGLAAVMFVRRRRRAA
ncbi:MAG: PEP-CTERM sorting domain-containing protein [Phycisphaerae bacterium]|nr:PEP-CTERM sorting domain-containing protein [Gemmatimonadaceae bacterium]